MTVQDTIEVKELIVDSAMVIANGASMKFCSSNVDTSSVWCGISYPNGGTGLVIQRSDSTGGFLAFDANGIAMSCDAVATPDAHAVLTLTSTTKGFLPPRMTTAQKNTLAGLTPTSGTIVYDTTLNKLCVFTGAAFETITSV